MKEYKFKINGTDYNVTVEDPEENVVNVVVNGNSHKVELEDMPMVAPAPVVRPRPVAAATPAVAAATPAAAASAPAAAPVAAGDGKPLKTPLPGVVLEIYVNVGDTIKAGQKVLMLEAMKMENSIEADKDGVVKAIKVSKGDSVQEGDVLILIG